MKNRTTLIVALALFALIVATVPAGAKPPEGKGKPPKPPEAVPIAVSLDANPMWVHEGADIIKYNVTLENKTSDMISGVVVVFTAAIDLVEVTVGDIEPNSSENVGFWRTVSEFVEEAGPCLVDDDPYGGPDECPLPATAEVFINVTDGNLLTGDLLTQVTMSTPLMPIQSCGFEYDADFIRSTSQVTVSDICIWTLPEIGEVETRTGVWGITLDPDLPDNPKRHISAGVSVRDGVPGNWCSMAVDGDWGFGERRWDGVSLIVGEVYLPGAENLPNDDALTLGLGVGVCLAGGAGGDYFAVGNPDSFYLRTNGLVTVQWLGPNPDDWEPLPDPNG